MQGYALARSGRASEARCACSLRAVACCATPPLQPRSTTKAPAHNTATMLSAGGYALARPPGHAGAWQAMAGRVPGVHANTGVIVGARATLTRRAPWMRQGRLPSPALCPALACSAGVPRGRTSRHTPSCCWLCCRGHRRRGRHAPFMPPTTPPRYPQGGVRWGMHEQGVARPPKHRGAAAGPPAAWRPTVATRRGRARRQNTRRRPWYRLCCLTLAAGHVGTAGVGAKQPPAQPPRPRRTHCWCACAADAWCQLSVVQRGK